MKMTPWRKPVAECGGINDLIATAYRQQRDCVAFSVEVVVHAYREVGTSLEASLEVRYWTLSYDTKKMKHIRINHGIEFTTFIC